MINMSIPFGGIYCSKKAGYCVVTTGGCVGCQFNTTKDGIAWTERMCWYTGKICHSITCDGCWVKMQIIYPATFNRTKVDEL